MLGAPVSVGALFEGTAGDDGGSDLAGLASVASGFFSVESSQTNPIPTAAIIRTGPALKSAGAATAINGAVCLGFMEFY
jgi:hypothetical protein